MHACYVIKRLLQCCAWQTEKTHTKNTKNKQTKKQQRQHRKYWYPNCLCTYLSTGLVEGSQWFERTPFGIEANDILHDLWVLAPVQRLQVVCCHHVDLFLAWHTREEHNLFRVSRLQQSLHCLCVDKEHVCRSLQYRQSIFERYWLWLMDRDMQV